MLCMSLCKFSVCQEDKRVVKYVHFRAGQPSFERQPSYEYTKGRPKVIHFILNFIFTKCHRRRPRRHRGHAPSPCFFTGHRFLNIDIADLDMVHVHCHRRRRCGHRRLRECRRFCRCHRDGDNVPWRQGGGGGGDRRR